jgi:hypothetical protein
MSIIRAGTTTTTALTSIGNTDGTIQLQVNGTTPSVTLNTLGAVGVGASPNFGTSGQALLSAGSTAAPAWGNVQAPLVSGTTIKTVNSTSLLGSGDVAVQPTLVSGTNIKTVNSTTLLGSGDVAVQATLVSGTNIKTINGGSVLGSGDLVVGGGAWKFIGALTASNSATLIFDNLIPADYAAFYFVIDRIKSSTTGFKDLWLQLSINNGASYISTYSNCRLFVGSSVGSTRNVDGQIQISGSAGMNNHTNGGISGSLLIVEPGNAQNKTAFATVSNIQSNTETNITFENAAYTVWTTSAINACKFFASSDNLSGGTIRLYGLNKV